MAGSVSSWGLGAFEKAGRFILIPMKTLPKSNRGGPNIKKNKGEDWFFVWGYILSVNFFVECTNVPSIFQEVIRLDEGDVFATRNDSLGMTIWVFP